MEVTKDQRKIIAFCNEQYQIAHIRRIKLVREIAEGKQRRVSEWVS